MNKIQLLYPSGVPQMKHLPGQRLVWHLTGHCTSWQKVMLWAKQLILCLCVCMRVCARQDLTFTPRACFPAEYGLQNEALFTRWLYIANKHPGHQDHVSKPFDIWLSLRTRAFNSHLFSVPVCSNFQAISEALTAALSVAVHSIALLCLRRHTTVRVDSWC